MLTIAITIGRMIVVSLVGIITTTALMMPITTICDRDKSGTTGGAGKNTGSQVAMEKQLASLSSFEAERGGLDRGGFSNVLHTFKLRWKPRKHNHFDFSRYCRSFVVV